MTISKAKRQIVFDKFGGRCAYCGQELKKGWNIDHVHPTHLLSGLPDDDIKNLFPSCRRCNICKGGFTLENFRRELQLQVKRLRKNSQFKRALDYGQIQLTETPIVFYFEVMR